MKSINIVKIIFGVFLILLLCSPRSIYAQESENNLVLFVEEGCPYCAKVKDFIEKNNLLEIQILDIREDPQNAEFYNSVCDKAGIDLYDRGVPLFYDNGNTVLDANEIIKYLGNKYNISVEEEEQDTNSESKKSKRVVLIILGLGLGFSLLFILLSKKKQND